MAPTYAMLTLAYLEENLYEIICQKSGNDIKVFSLMREKIFGWLLHNREIPMGRHQRIARPTTKLHPKIKFTLEHSLKELPFLDILIKNVNGQIITDINHKPTDTQQYLHFRSHHPKNRIESILYTLARRIYMIITDKNLKKLDSKNYTQPYTRENIKQN